eukprot:scaffold6206_cov238-Isochrysis_galbana.AAC.1
MSCTRIWCATARPERLCSGVRFTYMVPLLKAEDGHRCAVPAGLFTTREAVDALERGRMQRVKHRYQHLGFRPASLLEKVRIQALGHTARWLRLDRLRLEGLAEVDTPIG